MTTMHVHMYTEYNFYTPFPETVDWGGGGGEEWSMQSTRSVCGGRGGERSRQTKAERRARTRVKEREVERRKRERMREREKEREMQRKSGKQIDTDRNSVKQSDKERDTEWGQIINTNYSLFIDHTGQGYDRLCILTKQTVPTISFTCEKSSMHIARKSSAGRQNVDTNVAMPRPWEAVTWPIRPAM